MNAFADRGAAGRTLGALLADYSARHDVLVLGLPRGGVPVAAEVAELLGAPLDVLVVRKLGAPGQPELAIGAIASGDVIVLNERTQAFFARAGNLSAEIERERIELRRREALYRNGRLPLQLEGRTVILVDDGAATGASMRAAVRAARRRGAKRIVAAIPVAAPDALAELRSEADEVVCAFAPEGFGSVGEWYGTFDQTSDAEVAASLSRAHDRERWQSHSDGSTESPRPR